MAHRVHEGQCRRDGQPFVTHPIAVAKLVASWGMDTECVVAALLHDAVEDTPLTFGEVEQEFGTEVRTLPPRPRAAPPAAPAPRVSAARALRPPTSHLPCPPHHNHAYHRLTSASLPPPAVAQVRSLVQGVTRVSKMDPSKLEELEHQQKAAASRLIMSIADDGTADDDADEAGSGSSSSSVGERAEYTLSEGGLVPGGASDDLLRLLHACAGDWRVAVLKVADRLHNMRTLSAMKPGKRAKKAQETERIFVPLAHYLGAHEVAYELARLSARHRADGLTGGRRLAARVKSSLVVAPRHRIAQALTSLGHAVGGDHHLSVGSVPLPSSSVSRLPAFRPPRIPRRELGSERRLRKLILQLDEAEPDRGLELYVRLRPLHERLTRHQAVMMRDASWNPYS